MIEIGDLVQPNELCAMWRSPLFSSEKVGKGTFGPSVNHLYWYELRDGHIIKFVSHGIVIDIFFQQTNGDLAFICLDANGTVKLFLRKELTLIQKKDQSVE